MLRSTERDCSCWRISGSIPEPRGNLRNENRRFKISWISIFFPSADCGFWQCLLWFEEVGMRREVLTFTVVFLVALVSLFKLPKSQQAIEAPLMSVQQEIPRAKLSEAEDRDLEKLTPQTLSWLATWLEPTNCLLNEDIQRVDFAERYKKHEGQDIEMGVEVHQRSLVVYFDALHISLRFARLYNSGLSPAENTLFCEDNY